MSDLPTLARWSVPVGSQRSRGNDNAQGDEEVGEAVVGLGGVRGLHGLVFLLGAFCGVLGEKIPRCGMLWMLVHPCGGAAAGASGEKM